MSSLRDRLIAIHLPGQVGMKRSNEDAADLALRVFSEVLSEWSHEPGMQYRAEAELLRRSLELALEVGVDCTHGADCQVHPDVNRLHNFDPRCKWPRCVGKPAVTLGHCSMCPLDTRLHNFDQRADT